ncbi:MAG: MFS transporter [Desulfovibrionaceae bacterium]|nr:MFS transporter [Desulfovibrionaceae bacterium]
MLSENLSSGGAAPEAKLSQAPGKMLSRDFVLLLTMTMCSNIAYAVYYCFEQWLTNIDISPNWRGALISSFFAMILIFRPLASFLLLRRSKIWVLSISIILSSLAMMSYLLVDESRPVEFILALRIVQGITLAFYSSCTVAVLVDCIPKGKSAQGFALFSLAHLLPNAVIPILAESLLPLLGSEPRLFAAAAALGLSSLFLLIPLAPRLKKKELDADSSDEETPARGELLRSVAHSGLFLIFMACLASGVMVMMVNTFIKGLCVIKDIHPAMFFTTYSLVMIGVRLLGGRRLNNLPRYRSAAICCALMAAGILGLAWGPLWGFIPFSILYGLGMSVLYPMTASAIYERSRPGARSINSNLMMATFDASGIIGPMLGGLLINAGFGYRGVFAGAAMVAAVCAACMWIDWLKTGRKIKTEEQCP